MTIATSYENLTYNSPDGALIGSSATEKIGFFGATPVVQPTGLASALSTSAAVSGAFGYSSAVADEIVERINEIRTALVNLGIVSGT